MKRNTVLLMLLSVVTLAGLLFKARPDELAEELADASPTYLILAVIVYIFTIFLKMARWHLLLHCTGNRVRFRKTALFFLMGLSVNSVTPGGVSGEPVRLYFLNRERGVSVGQGMATIFAERFMDITVLISFALFSLLFIFPLLSPHDFYQLLIPVVLVALLLFMVADSVVHPSFMDRLTGFSMRVLHRLFPGKSHGEKLCGMMKMFQMGVQDIAASGKRGVMFFALSYLIWLLSTLRIYILLLAMDVEVSIFAVFLTSSITYIFGVILPGGTGNIAAIAGVFSAVGVDFDTATAVGVLEVATSLLISVPAGLGAMAATGVRIEKQTSGTVEKGKNEEEEMPGNGDAEGEMQNGLNLPEEGGISELEPDP